ncbi:hypothetical protein D3C75_670170 [compost metagenome]
MILQPLQVIRPTAGHHHHNRFAGGDQGFQQLLLYAGQIQAVGIRALPDGTALEQARQVAHAGHHQITVVRHPHGVGDQAGIC